VKRILVLLHEYERPGKGRNLVDALAEAWRGQGVEVSFVSGIRTRPEADLLIPHVNLTRTPPEYVEYIESFAQVVNRGVLDISKRKVSRHLLSRQDAYPGPVIVKTDENSGGRPEHRLSRYRQPLRTWLRRRAAWLAEALPGQELAWRRELSEYPVYDSLARVPPGAFRNPALVVEQFLPEREGDRYFMRYYLFLGDHTRSSRVMGTGPFLKRADCKPVDEGLEVPREVVDLRRRLGMDYGKIDYTIHEGQVVILDANRTPAPPGTPDATARTVRDLAGGIGALFSGT